MLTRDLLPDDPRGMNSETVIKDFNLPTPDTPPCAHCRTRVSADGDWYLVCGPCLDAVRQAMYMTDRTRRAIRDRHRAGESLEDLARDYGVMIAFVEYLVAWQFGGEEP